MVTIKTDLVLFYFTDHTPLYCIEIARRCLRKLTNFKSFSFDGFSDNPGKKLMKHLTKNAKIFENPTPLDNIGKR